MAAGYFRKLLDDQSIKEVDIRSAGVMTITGLLASQEAIQVMDAEGVDLRRHRSTQLTAELIRKADLILAMSPFHRQTALRLCEDAKNKTFLFKEFTKSDLKNVQIADPMGCTLEVFKKCFKEIRAACERLVEHEFITGRPILPRVAVKKPPVKAAGKSPVTGKSPAKGGGGKGGGGGAAKSGSPAKSGSAVKGNGSKGSATAAPAVKKPSSTPASASAAAKASPAKPGVAKATVAAKATLAGKAAPGGKAASIIKVAPSVKAAHGGKVAAKSKGTAST